MYQQFEYPEELIELVGQLQYKAGWVFKLNDEYDRGQGSRGMTLLITIETPNSYDPTQMRRVAHLFPVPPAAYNRQSWRRWLLEQVLLVEKHEAMEFFTVSGEKPFAPNHGPGNDPYTIRELTTDQARRTAFTGIVNT